MISKVLLLSPPYMQLSKPDFAIPKSLEKGIPYMNPGLLISSAILNQLKIDNQIIKIKDIHHLDELKDALDGERCPLIGISCTAAWEYLESLRLAEYAKRKNPNAITLISGWQIKSIQSQVFSDSPYIDYAVIGDAETTLPSLISNINNKKNNSISGVLSKEKQSYPEVLPKVEFQILDFSKYPNYLDYVPYVEESRNCPCSCFFCLNSCVQDRYQIVPIDIFKQNIERIEGLYGKDASAVLLAANFGVNKEETKKKLAYLKTKSLKWNMELHVDNPWDTYIDDLKEAGITKLSIGFESASPTMLRYMNKSRNIPNYLTRLTNMLQELKKRGIRVSLNTLFDFRETPETMQETISFLRQNKELYSAAKMNYMFGFEGLFRQHPDFVKYALITPIGKRTHAYPLLPQGYTPQKMVELIEQYEEEFKDKKIGQQVPLKFKNNFLNQKNNRR